jgi:hypothetical protein
MAKKAVSRDDLRKKVLAAFKYEPCCEGSIEFEIRRHRKCGTKSHLRHNNGLLRRPAPSLRAASSGSVLAFRPPDPIFF